jgi:Bacterial nucleoid DNA-binding protein
MNKSQLIEVVSKDTGLKKKDAEAAVNAFINAVESALLEGEKVQLVGFGAFEVKERAARIGRNPSTGEALPIAASKYPSFAPGKALKEKLN